jgi:hypothetical protein
VSRSVTIADWTRSQRLHDSAVLQSGTAAQIPFTGLLPALAVVLSLNRAVRCRAAYRVHYMRLRPFHTSDFPHQHRSVCHPTRTYYRLRVEVHREMGFCEMCKEHQYLRRHKGCRRRGRPWSMDTRKAAETPWFIDCGVVSNYVPFPCWISPIRALG